MRIIRVFPRRTAATPNDALAFTSPPPKDLPEADEVHVSVAFTYDLPKAEKLAEAWARTGLPVKLGGPAFNQPGGDFVSGLYLKHGYVITSCGCPRRCWFCSVPVREGGKLRELPVTNGHNVLDDNLLACSEGHIRGVFAMLKQQAKRPVFTGGLEAVLLRPWHVKLLREVKAARMYFAYDTPSDYEPLAEAGRILRDGGITKASHLRRVMCWWTSPSTRWTPPKRVCAPLGSRVSYPTPCSTGTVPAWLTRTGADFNALGCGRRSC
jgi:hypothetical protein